MRASLRRKRKLVAVFTACSVSNNKQAYQLRPLHNVPRIFEKLSDFGVHLQDETQLVFHRGTKETSYKILASCDRAVVVHVAPHILH